MRSFSNCNIAVMLAHYAECICRFKLILSCSLTCLTPLSDPVVPPSFLRWGYDLLKSEIRARMQKMF